MINLEAFLENFLTLRGLQGPGAVRHVGASCKTQVDSFYLRKVHEHVTRRAQTNKSENKTAQTKTNKMNVITKGPKHYLLPHGSIATGRKPFLLVWGEGPGCRGNVNR